MAFALITEDRRLSFDPHHPNLDLFAHLLNGKPYLLSLAYDRSLAAYVAEESAAPVNVYGTILLAALGGAQTRWAGPIILCGAGLADITLRHRVMTEDLYLGIGQVLNRLPSGRGPEWESAICGFHQMATSKATGDL